MLKKLYHSSPARWMQFIRRKKATPTAEPVSVQEEVPVNPLQRRFEQGQLKPYPATYMIERDELLSSLILPAVSAAYTANPSADFPSDLLDAPIYSQYDERLIEYSWILWKLTDQDRTASQTDNHLLDAGCVLNNAVIAPYLSESFNGIWFMNPAQETLVYKDNVSYLLTDIRTHFLPPG